MYLMCLVYVFNVVNYIYLVSVFHVSIFQVWNIIDFQIKMVNMYGKDTIKA